MKSKKVKIEKKALKKSEKRVAKKELETSITDKFLEVIRSLGHEAGNLTKDVKKLSRTLAKKLADKVSLLKDDSQKKQSGTPRVAIKRAVRAPKKELAKAEKVVERANTRSAPAKRTASAVKVKPAVKTTGVAAAKAPRAAVAKKPGPARVKPAPGTPAAPPKAGRPKSAGVSSVVPTVRKPRVKATISNSNEDKNQPENVSADLVRTNNTDTL